MKNKSLRDRLPKSWKDVKTRNYLKYIQWVTQMNEDMELAKEFKEQGKIDEYNEIILDYLPLSTSIETIKILGDLTDNDVDDLTIQELDEYAKDVRFIVEHDKLIKNKKPMELVIKDGKEQFMFKPLDTRTVKETKQMEVYQYVHKDDVVSRMAYMYAVILRPFTKTKDKVTKKEVIEFEPLDYNKIEYFKELILEQPVSNILGLNDFFLSIHTESLKTTKKSSPRIKQNQDKERASKD